MKTEKTIIKIEGQEKGDTLVWSIYERNNGSKATFVLKDDDRTYFSVAKTEKKYTKEFLIGGREFSEYAGGNNLRVEIEIELEEPRIEIKTICNKLLLDRDPKADVNGRNLGFSYSFFIEDAFGDERWSEDFTDYVIHLDVLKPKKNK